MDSLSDIAKLLRAARALLGFRQDEMADRARVSRQMIARIESAGKGIPFDAVEKVKSALERDGVVFLPSGTTHGPGVALRKKAQDSVS